MPKKFVKGPHRRQIVPYFKCVIFQYKTLNNFRLKTSIVHSQDG